MESGARPLPATWRPRAVPVQQVPGEHETGKKTAAVIEIDKLDPVSGIFLV